MEVFVEHQSPPGHGGRSRGRGLSRGKLEQRQSSGESQMEVDAPQHTPTIDKHSIELTLLVHARSFEFRQNCFELSRAYREGKSLVSPSSVRLSANLWTGACTTEHLGGWRDMEQGRAWLK